MHQALCLFQILPLFKLVFTSSLEFYLQFPQSIFLWLQDPGCSSNAFLLFPLCKYYCLHRVCLCIFVILNLLYFLKYKRFVSFLARLRNAIIL